MILTTIFNFWFYLFLAFHQTADNLGVLSTYSSALTIDSQSFARPMAPCRMPGYYYEALGVNVVESGSYNLSSNSTMDTYGFLYNGSFNSSHPDRNLLDYSDDSADSAQFRLTIFLRTNTTYILLVTTFPINTVGRFSISISGPNSVRLEHIRTGNGTFSIHWQTYSSELTNNSQTYSPNCRISNYYYETIEINVESGGFYWILLDSGYFPIYGYIYEHSFDPFKPFKNLVFETDGFCYSVQSESGFDLLPETTYILVITTILPNKTTDFSIFASGSSNISLNRTIQSQSSCFIGGKCHLYDKSNGLTLDDILRDEIQPNMTLKDQPLTVKMSAAATIIIFIGGIVNSILSWLTFHNEELRQVGCVMYLLASSITSLLAVSMFTVKFWFVLLTQMNASVSVSVLRGGCKSIETILKLFVYLDTWLNACVAVERAVSVSKGVNFDKAKSKRVAWWIILILPFCIMGSIIHEPLYRELFVNKNTIANTTEGSYREVVLARANITQNNITENYAFCLVHYSPTVQKYNTAILLLHIVIPFIANLFSALFIIFKAARHRSTARTQQSYKEHVYEQLNAHRQLIISPLVLLVLSSPRLIISLLSSCVNISRNIWLYLFAYFISFTPSMLVFVIFVLPSELYRNKFKESLLSWRRQTRQ